jgi:hypothetical protein
LPDHAVAMNRTVNVVVTSTDKPLISSTSELSTGDWIRATYKGTLVHLGQVTDIAPNQDLFWIRDSLSGSRRLLDLTDFGITRTEAPKSPSVGLDAV